MACVPRHEFKLRPSTPEQEVVLRALDGLRGFSSRLGSDGYFHVEVVAPSFDEAQDRLRDTVADLEDPPTVVVPVVLKRSAHARD